MSEMQKAAIKNLLDPIKADVSIRVACHELIAGGATSTLMADISSTFEALGFTVTREGHYWNITV